MATEEARPYLDGTNWPIHTFVGVASPRRKNVLAAPIGGNVATVIDKYIFGKAAGYDLDEELWQHLRPAAAAARPLQRRALRGVPLDVRGGRVQQQEAGGARAPRSVLPVRRA